jgi:hypothetical protein
VPQTAVREVTRRIVLWGLAGAFVSLLVAFAGAAWSPSCPSGAAMTAEGAADFFAARYPRTVHGGITFTGTTKAAPGASESRSWPWSPAPRGSCTRTSSPTGTGGPSPAFGASITSARTSSSPACAGPLSCPPD